MVSKYSSSTLFVFLAIGAVFLISAGVLLGLKFFTYGIVLLLLGLCCVARPWFLYRLTNRNIAFFFDSVRNNDTTAVFSTTTRNKSLDLLHNSLNNLNQYIQNIRLEAEMREKYYKTIIRLSNTGFVVLSKSKDIELINEAACLFAGINPSSSNMNLLKQKNPVMFDAICFLKPGDNITFKNYNKFTIQELLLRATEIRTAQKEIMLVSIQDIRGELIEKEVESYQKLISILTHEIMNSLAPLTSLSKTLTRIYTINGENIRPSEIQESHIATTVLGLNAIETQSTGLIDFVNNYRRLTKIPNPVITEIDITEWMEQIKVSYTEKFEAENIRFDILIQEGLKYLLGDKNLLNQVLINLINNSVDALKEIRVEKKIRINVFKEGNTAFLQVGNNGPVIPQEMLEKIFIPFFTTKENGSGIGLSISQQIMNLHKGTIDVFSNTQTGTIFTLKLQALF
jgi:signal transduction histidine kinase